MSYNVWITSDSHFGHENMYRFTMPDGSRVRKEFMNAAEGDAAMIERWQAVVKPEDHVWHLGDVVMERGSEVNAWRMREILQQLPGHKRLILGNHDHFDVRVYRNVGFEKVYGSHVLDQLLLSHYPLHAGSITPRMLGNVHGHIHRHPSPPGRYFNASVESNNYTPIHVDDVIAALKARKDPDEPDHAMSVL